MGESTTNTEKSAVEDEFKSALDAFETSLATPIVSGELSDWLEATQNTWAEAASQITDRIEKQHPPQFEAIGKQDMELLPTVERLQAEDTAIASDLAAYHHGISRYAEQIPKLEPNEEKAQHYIKKLIDEGIALIVRVRKQEVAIQTWYIEAFNRDRGPVD